MDPDRPRPARPWRALIRPTGLLLTLALAGLLAACGRESSLPPDLEALRRDVPLSEAFDFTYLYSDSARLKARLQAPYDLERMDPERKEPVHQFEKGLKIEFYDRAGRVETTITARSGKLWKKAGLAEARGQVKLVNYKGEVLESEHLIWDRASKRIHTAEPVKITTAREVIYGTGLESDLRFSRYKIFKTRGIITLDS